MKKIRRCVDGGGDISHRGPTSTRCEKHQKIRDNKLESERQAERRRTDPIYREKQLINNRKYKAKIRNDPIKNAFHKAQRRQKHTEDMADPIYREYMNMKKNENRKKRNENPENKEKERAGNLARYRRRKQEQILKDIQNDPFYKLIYYRCIVGNRCLQCLNPLNKKRPRAPYLCKKCQRIRDIAMATLRKRAKRMGLIRTVPVFMPLGPYK